MAKQLTAHKAKLILEEGIAQGKKITPKQRRFFGWVAGGRKKPHKGVLRNIR
jgi:hypothetical protein